MAKHVRTVKIEEFKSSRQVRQRENMDASRLEPLNVSWLADLELQDPSYPDTLAETTGKFSDFSSNASTTGKLR